MDLRPHIERFARKLAETEAALSDPGSLANNQKFQELSREYANLKELADHGRAWLKAQTDLADNQALLRSEPPDSELAQLARDEIARLTELVETLDASREQPRGDR